MLRRLFAFMRTPWRTPRLDGIKPRCQNDKPSLSMTVCRYPHLLPQSTSVADYAAWLAQIGEEASDESLSWYAEMCELARVVRGDPDPVPPAKMRRPVPDPVPASVPAEIIILRKPATVQEAASEFLAWVISTGQAGTYSSGDLRRMYSRYCNVELITPSPENKLRGVLRTLPGVTTRQKIVARVSRKESRVREWHWTFAPPAEVQSIKLAA